jgi:transcriptional regulator with XRE-family HTH domain
MSKKKQQPDLLQQIRSAIVASGLTQEALSQLTGITQGRISEFASGKRDMHGASLAKLCKALGLIVVKSAN